MGYDDCNIISSKQKSLSLLTVIRSGMSKQKKLDLLSRFCKRTNMLWLASVMQKQLSLAQPNNNMLLFHLRVECYKLTRKKA